MESTAVAMGTLGSGQKKTERQLLEYQKRVNAKIKREAVLKNRNLVVQLEKIDMHYKNWAKTIKKVDLVKTDKDDIFVGEYVKNGSPIEMPEDTYILDYREKRGKDGGEVIARLYQVINNEKSGNLTMVYQKQFRDSEQWVNHSRHDIFNIISV